MMSVCVVVVGMKVESGGGGGDVSVCRGGGDVSGSEWWCDNGGIVGGG